MRKVYNTITIYTVLCFSTVFLFAQNINNGLVAYYPFNGDVIDFSGNGNDGLINGGAQLGEDRFGNPNASYLFDGLDDNIDINSYANMSPMEGVSISAWIKTTYSEGSPIIYERLEAEMGFGLRLTEDGYLRLSINGGLQDVVSTEIITTDKWYHVVGTYDLTDGELKLYIYGDENNVNYYSSPINYSIEPRNSIGAYGTSYPGAYFKGSIDEVRVYDRALTGEEVKEVFTIECSQTINNGVNNQLLDNIFADDIVNDFDNFLDNDDINLDDDVLSVYPNPANQYILVTESGEKTISNLLGDIVISTDQNKIDVSNFSTGIYIVSLNNRSKKFIKK